MTAYKQDGTRLTKTSIASLSTAVTEPDPLRTITENIYEGTSIGVSKQTVGKKGLDAGRRLKFKAGQKVRQSEIDALFPTATVSTVIPATGPIAGGTSIVITGTELSGASGVTVGGVAATSFKVENDSTIRCNTPAAVGALSAPVQAALATAATGGTLAAGTYNYVVTAINAQGETIASNERSIVTTGATSTATVSWAAVTGATGYRIYRRGATGGYGATSRVASVGAVTSYADTGAALTAGTPPTVNGTGVRDVVVADDSGNVTKTGAFTYV